jgi:Putative phage serine protease XkdF
MIKNEELYELVIEDENIDGIFAISLVQDPAIEADFVYFDKEKVLFSSVDDEQRLVMGAILIPNKKILRIDGEGKPYHVFFKPETIKKLSEMYLKNKYTDKATLEHNEKINGVTLVESWIKESASKDKSALYNLNAPVGSWLGTFKIDNDKIWNDYVKTGEVKGFSIEGLFGHSLVSANEKFNLEKDIDLFSEVEAEILLEKIKQMFESYSDYGDDIRNNAKRGIELNEKVGNKCATQTGKVRAQQLANGEPISVDTLKRMYSYLSRAEVYYDESDTEACGTISYLLWGGKSALSYSRNKLKELGLLEESEAQPSVASTYPGEAASGSIAPALLALESCPPATQNVALNLYNRSIAIKQANYGPLNPNEPNDAYWEAKAGEFGGSVEEAKTALCGNCAFFDVRKQTLDCIAEGIGYEDDPELVIEAGQLGYCEAFDFKCAAKRTCSAWVVGGPIKD